MNTNNTLFAELPKESALIIENFDSIVQSVKPLNSKQLYKMPELIKELSHQLTDERTNRRIGYMNDIPTLSAYIRYFMWWNLVRLTPLFAGFLENSQGKAFLGSLNDDSIILDLGSGPLTVPIALWLSCPNLRQKKLTFYCLDYSQSALSFGEEIFLSIVAKTFDSTPNQKEWNIVRVKGEVGTEIRKKADFVTCANMFNELYWNTAKPLEEIAKKYTSILLSYANENAAFLVIEPGVPRAARFITLLRDCFIRKKMQIILPCTHHNECCMDGRKGKKWCHFTLFTENAPKKLHKLSDSSKLTKDRLSFSFVFAQAKPCGATGANGVRNGDGTGCGNKGTNICGATGANGVRNGNGTGCGNKGTHICGATSAQFSASDTSAIIRDAQTSAQISASDTTSLRIISDAIKLPQHKTGRYACSPQGLTLFVAPEKASKSGDVVEVPKSKTQNPQIDKKSGAKIIAL